MARERLNAQRALEQMAAALSGDCEKVLDTGGTFFPTLMVWHEDDDLARPGAVVVFEPDTEDRRPGHALQLARERLDAFTRAAAGWANNPANHARSAEILAAHTKIPLAVLGKMNRATYGYTYDTTFAQPLLDAAYRYGSLPKPAAARELISG